MKILEVCQTADYGGVPRYVLDLAEGLLARGFSVFIGCPPDSALLPRAQAAGCPVFFVPMVRNISPVADLKALFRIGSLLRSERFDVVHAHSSKAGFLVRFAARLFGVKAPVVYTPHAYAFIGATGIRRRFYLGLERLAAISCSGMIVAVSESERNATIENRICLEQSIRVIRTGRDFSEFDKAVNLPDERQQLSMPAHSTIITTVSRLYPQKNLECFIEAAALILLEIPDAHFLVVGGGPEENNLGQLAVRRGLGERVHFLGWRDDVPSILAVSDICVSTSDYEGLPYAVLEYMAARKPVVATDVPGNSDIVENGVNGLLVPRRDPAAVARAVIGICRNPALGEALVSGARRTVSQVPPPEAMAQEYALLYRELAQRSIRARNWSEENARG